MATDDSPRFGAGPLPFDRTKPRKVKPSTEEQDRLTALKWHAYTAEVAAHKPALALPNFDKRPKRKHKVDPDQLGLWPGPDTK